MTKKNNNQSPCEKCKLVPNPQACDRKICPAWRKWWIARWDKMRRGFMKAGKS